MIRETLNDCKENSGDDLVFQPNRLYIFLNVEFLPAPSGVTHNEKMCIISSRMFERTELS